MEPENEQIKCVFASDDEIVIFDKDTWQCNSDLVGPLTADQQSHANKQVLDKIDETRDNFFRVKVSNAPPSHKLPERMMEIQGKGIQPSESKGKSPISTKSIKRLPALPNSPNKVILEGPLDKKVDGIIFVWQTRYMALTTEKLYMFRDASRTEVIGCVNLKLITAQLTESNECIQLDFYGECEKIILRVIRKEDHEKWVFWLQTVLEFHAKAAKLLIQTINKPLYENKDTISEAQFHQVAETGDILLFYTANLGANLQRVFTSSDYDHVALVIRLRNRDLAVFESNGMHGVSIYNWDQYIEYFDLYQKVTLRKLNYLKKADIQNGLLEFMKRNIGRNYDIGAIKLLKMESDFDWSSASAEIDNDRGFFCSQLIAKAYKAVGILNTNKSSGRFWPVDFTSKNKLPFKVGVSLGEEQTIILSKHLKPKKLQKKVIIQ